MSIHMQLDEFEFCEHGIGTGNYDQEDGVSLNNGEIELRHPHKLQSWN